MKKLMIALAAVAVAAGVQAASFTWKTKSNQYVYSSGTTDKLSGVTAYIFDAATVSQASLVSAFALDQSFDTSKSLSSVSVSNGTFNQTIATEYGTAESTYSLYFALVNGDELYISDAQDYVAPAVAAAATVQFSPKASSKLAALDAAAGYKSEGWYTQTVPEPTSGLLLLLGVAGLALRRRRA